MKPSRIRQPNLPQVFTLCFLAVGALFLGYEIVERTWLRGVGPEMLHFLRIVREFSAAVVAAVLATFALMHRPDDAASNVIPSRSKNLWKRRLQHVPLRTKIAIPMVALAILPTITVGSFMISRMRKSLSETAIRQVEFDTASSARAIQEFLEAVQRDLHFLSQIKVVRELVAAEHAGGPERVAVLRRKVEQDFLVFSQGKRAYYQVRYLNGLGHEVVRLNVESGSPKTVPAEELQDKSNRYYVEAAFALEPGEIYVSPMDLNVEHGKVESPPRGVIRYATPVFGEEGPGRGLLVINVYADHLFSLIQPLAPNSEAWLVDQGGTYLGYVGESEERRNLFSLRTPRQLSEDYAPEECRAILRQSTGGLSVTTEEAFLSNASVSMDQRDPQRHWTLMIGRPRDPLEAPIRNLSMFLGVVMTFVLAISAILGVLIGDYLVRPIVRLQQATRDIAAGNLDKHVDIATGDEIERLASDFNAMTKRLRDAQGQLSAWNLKLEQEVTRQTAILHRLQSGMARADKLASIGQVTAGVMHEVGNPLAAIKTKIQVAEEHGDMCQECEGLLSEILAEVDRLAAFLRTFSRLSRLGGYQVKDDVSLAETADDVIGLVSAELRRKGVGLRCEADDEVPKIRGVADQLRQLMMNLILNAADASGAGDEVVLRVKRVAETSSTNATPDSVSLQVIDKGLGISEDILDRIWDPFVTTKDEGTGLGLAICRQIAQDHGGSIHIDSEVGEGTVVTVTFPGRVTGEATTARIGPRTTSTRTQEQRP